MQTSRRNFVRLTGAAGAGLILGGLGSCNTPEFEMKFAGFIDGDMLTELDGMNTVNGLFVPLKVEAPAGLKLTINGIVPEYNAGVYTSNLLLNEYLNKVEVVEKRSGKSQSITLFRLKNYTGKYRFSLDDNIWFLKDISQNSSRYKSIFQNPYLGFLKEVHDTYGTKIHINIYYQCDGFNLSQMTDKYKSEWIDNSGWLRLSFHALQNDPDMPYLNSGYDEVKRDCEQVKEQIRRFAGEELMGPVTTLHWGEAKVDGCRALRDSGYKALAGYFNLENEKPVVSYYLNREQTENISNRSIWFDSKEGIIFKKIHMVINSYPIDQIVPLLDKIKLNPVSSAFLDLMIHEQYFHKTYRDYQPDYKEKVMLAMKWATDNGYKPSFLTDCIFS
jgi:hypothetical protein